MKNNSNTEIKILIRGTKPIMFHRFNLENLTDQTKPKVGSAGNNPEEWKKSFYHVDGKLFFPSDCVFSTLKNGAVYTKAGRGTLKNTWVAAIEIKENQVFLDREMFENWENLSIDEVPKGPLDPVYVDVRMVANPNTKGRNVRYRVACAPGWQMQFTLMADLSLLSMQQIEKIVNDTGKMQGFGEARTLGYGRYEVLEFNPKKYKDLN